MMSDLTDGPPRFIDHLFIAARSALADQEAAARLEIVVDAIRDTNQDGPA